MSRQRTHKSPSFSPLYNLPSTCALETGDSITNRQRIMYIPNELCGKIVDHLIDRGDLYQLLFVSPAFQREAQRAMLVRVDIAEWKNLGGANSEGSLGRSKQLFGFLSRNISLASAVRQLTYCPGVIEDAHINLVIPHMVNLRHFNVIGVGANVPTDPIPPSIIHCPCILLSFSLTQSVANLPTLVAFLKTQPNIVDLRLPRPLPSEFFSDGVLLPHLTTLCVQKYDPLALKTLLANRRIARMSILSIPRIQCMNSADFRHIRALFCSMLSDTVDTYYPTFENVEFLAIYMHGLCDVAKLGLPQFPNLKVLSVLSFAYVTLDSLALSLPSSSVPENMQAALSTLFDAHRSLHTIEVMTRPSPNVTGDMAVFNRALEITGSKRYNREEWKIYPL